MIKVLSAGQKVTDSLGIPNYQIVANKGYSASSRYLRNLTAREIQDAWNAGIGIILNDELGPGNEALGGSGAGLTAGKRAISQAIALGWSGETPIIYSGTDFDVQSSQYSVCDQYYGAIASLGNPWGLYGPWHYIAHAHNVFGPNLVYWASAGWQTGMNPIPNMQQEVLQDSINGVTVDVNLVITTLPVWTGKDDNIVSGYFRHNAAGVVYEFSQGYKWHVSGEYFYNALGGALYPNAKGLPDSPYSYQIGDDVFANVPDGPIPTNGTGAPTHFNISLTGTANA